MRDFIRYETFRSVSSFQKSSISRWACSFVRPYFCCRMPRSLSLLPLTCFQSSSVSSPHFFLKSPLSSLNFPLISLLFIEVHLQNFSCLCTSTQKEYDEEHRN